MKNTSKYKSFVALALALCMMWTLVSCSAGSDKSLAGENEFGQGYNNDTSKDLFPTEELPEDYGSWDEYYEENYGKLIENSWVSTETEPVSTFSSDVDTASYTRFRSFVNSGLPFEQIKNYCGASIRTEEMLNYFKYAASSPAGGDLFGMRSEISSCPWNPDAALLMMTFKAKEVQNENKGNNLVFLIDVSGSMNSADKLPLLKKAFRTLTNVLGVNDVVSIVTYSGKEEVVLSGCSGADKSKILGAVDKLSASGSTNGSAGMERAYSLAQDYYIEGGNNRIIMATDGDLNVGITSTDEILKYVEQKRESGVYISTVGFGTGGYSDAMLETIADNGNGAYYFVDGESEAEKIFGSDLTQTLYTVAKDVKFQITFNSEAIEEYRLVGYENRVMNNEDFENDAKDAGEVGSGAQLAVCYEIKLKDGANDIENWMSLEVRYKNPDEDTSVLDSYSITNSSYVSAPSPDFIFAGGVIALSMLLHDSKYITADGINLDFVKSALVRSGSNDFYKNELIGIIDKLR